MKWINWRVGLLLAGLITTGIASVFFMKDLYTKVNMLAAGTATTGFLQILVPIILKKLQELQFQKQVEIQNEQLESTREITRATTKEVLGDTVAKLATGVVALANTIDIIQSKQEEIQNKQEEIRNRQEEHNNVVEKAILDRIDKDKEENIILHKSHIEMFTEHSKRFDKIEGTLTETNQKVEKILEGKIIKY